MGSWLYHSCDTRVIAFLALSFLTHLQSESIGRKEVTTTGQSLSYLPTGLQWGDALLADPLC